MMKKICLIAKWDWFDSQEIGAIKTILNLNHHVKILGIKSYSFSSIRMSEIMRELQGMCIIETTIDIYVNVFYHLCMFHHKLIIHENLAKDIRYHS